MNKLFTLLIISVAILWTSCSTYSYVTGNATGNASLSCACKWKVVKNISATLEKQPRDTDIVAATKKKLLDENPLSDNQALANMTVDLRFIRKWMVIPFYWPYIPLGRRVVCTVTADVIEFEPIK
jgi:hypothetical protein